MCGIIGIASVAKCENRSWLVAGRDSMLHRGPDDAGEWWSSDGRVGLGHRRLSIVDLSEAGHQPMQNSVHGLSIVFNGEIYNFRELRNELSAYGYTFSTNSDTEVVLAAYDNWGTDCLARLNGMFAIAIFDASKESVFLARDRAGEKPLFYHLIEGESLRFASELKGLLADPSISRQLDHSALDYYLMMGYVPGQGCILRGYNKLPPAHALKFDLRSGKVQKWRYWQLPELDAGETAGQCDEGALLDELEALLEDSVRRQLAADVPVGVLLSGGVDSSLITAMAVRSSSRVQTFTIGFPGHGALDESEHARLIARHFGTQHTELMAEPATADLLPRLARQFDEPMADSSMIPTFLVSELVRRECTVALGGDGGDELFGGYGAYSKLLWMEERLGRFPLPLRRSVALAAEKLLPVGFKGRNWMQGLGEDLEGGLPMMASFFDATTRKTLLREHSPWTTTAKSEMQQRVPLNSDLLQRATRMDFQNYLAEDILVKVDRASMLSSLEVRAPLLDHRIVEFAFGKVPSYLKATRVDKKILLKRLTARVLPPEFDRHRKQGFSIPLAAWLKGGRFRELFHSVLLDQNCIFDRKIVTQLLSGQDRGLSNSERLFTLVLFELWRKEYKITL
jgi:asparagine synthase (glutamine-hydrolysing)